MEPPATGYDAIDHIQSSVHDWRVSQLTRLGPRAAGRGLRRPHRLASDCPAGVPRPPAAACPPHRLLTLVRSIQRDDGT